MQEMFLNLSLPATQSPCRIIVCEEPELVPELVGVLRPEAAGMHVQ